MGELLILRVNYMSSLTIQVICSPTLTSIFLCLQTFFTTAYQCDIVPYIKFVILFLKSFSKRVDVGRNEDVDYAICFSCKLFLICRTLARRLRKYGMA